MLGFFLLKNGTSKKKRNKKKQAEPKSNDQTVKNSSAVRTAGSRNERPGRPSLSVDCMWLKCSTVVTGFLLANPLWGGGLSPKIGYTVTESALKKG